MAIQAVITRSLAALTAAFVAAFFVPKAQAQMVCFDANGLSNFHKQFGEKEVARGALGNDGHKMALLVNPVTGTWTMMIVRAADGLLCPFASGADFKLTPVKTEGQKI